MLEDHENIQNIEFTIGANKYLRVKITRHTGPLFEVEFDIWVSTIRGASPSLRSKILLSAIKDDFKEIIGSHIDRSDKITSIYFEGCKFLSIEDLKMLLLEINVEIANIQFS